MGVTMKKKIHRICQSERKKTKVGMTLQYRLKMVMICDKASQSHAHTQTIADNNCFQRQYSTDAYHFMPISQLSFKPYQKKKMCSCHRAETEQKRKGQQETGQILREQTLIRGGDSLSTSVTATIFKMLVDKCRADG